MVSLAFNRGVRTSVKSTFPGVVRAFLAPQILWVLGLFVAWVLAWLGIASSIGVWNWSLLKDTVIIVSTVGLPLLFTTHNSPTGLALLRSIAKETVAWSALALFYVNLESFPLLGELVLQATLIFFTALLVFARHQEDSEKTVGCLTGALGVLGLFMIVWTTVQILTNYESYLTVDFARQLALSAWLPFALFPFLYLVAIFSAIEMILMRGRFIYSTASLGVKIGVVVGLRFSLRFAKALRGAHLQVLEADSFRGAKSQMKEFRKRVRQKEREEDQRQKDLVNFTGSAGVDDSGAQLDRREYHETKKVLEYIAGMQAGQRARRDGLFWDDLTDAAVGKKLPAPHGVIVETSPDKKQWRAWRRLPSGFVLGLGGISRTEQFRYAGADGPQGWPRESPEWIEADSEQTPPDWQRSDAPIT